MLLKKYKTLEEKYCEVGDIGTPQQLIRDARKYLSEEHCLFFESQMFLRNRNGTGNRFSRKFMDLMMEYYQRSLAGYKYMRTVFTLPYPQTIVNYMKKKKSENLNVNECEDDSSDGAPSKE